MSDWFPVLTLLGVGIEVTLAEVELDGPMRGGDVVKDASGFDPEVGTGEDEEDGEAGLDVNGEVPEREEDVEIVPGGGQGEGVPSDLGLEQMK